MRVAVTPMSRPAPATGHGARRKPLSSSARVAVICVGVKRRSVGQGILSGPPAKQACFSSSAVSAVIPPGSVSRIVPMSGSSDRFPPRVVDRRPATRRNLFDYRYYKPIRSDKFESFHKSDRSYKTYRTYKTY